MCEHRHLNVWGEYKNGDYHGRITYGKEKDCAFLNSRKVPGEMWPSLDIEDLWKTELLTEEDQTRSKVYITSIISSGC